MKLFKNWSLSLKLLGVSVVITLVCVYAGGFIFRKLVEREREINQKWRPHQYHYKIMKELVEEKKFTPEDAFKIIEKNQERRGPFESFLVNREGEILESHPATNEPKLNLKGEELLPLGENLFVVYPRQEHGMRGGGPFGPHHGPPRGGPMGPPPPGAGLIGLVSIGLSIVVGLGLSMVFLTLYIRRKSREAESVLLKLKSGDLKARFKIGQVDESSLLMVKFNEMADQIEGLVENLRSTEKARMVLLQELAHDLRTPVASLKNLQEMLLDKGHLMDEDKKRHVQTLAIKEVQYFERLVEDLLFLSGVNDPRYSGNFKMLDLGNIVTQELDVFETEKIHISFENKGSGKILGDEHLMRRLVKNALSNASRFAKANIKVMLEQDENMLSLKVIDDGSGMSESDLETFGLKKYSRKIESQNTISIGLGSVIMKKIMSLHEGDLKVKNHATGGLEVSFNFKK